MGLTSKTFTEKTRFAGRVVNVPTGHAPDAVAIIDGSAGKKAVLTNGVTLITGGTGIPDLTLASPVAGDVAIIRIDSTTGDVVITCAGTLNAAGNNKMTLDAANEGVILVSAEDGKYVVAANIGGVVFATAE